MFDVEFRLFALLFRKLSDAPWTFCWLGWCCDGGFGDFGADGARPWDLSVGEKAASGAGPPDR